MGRGPLRANHQELRVGALLCNRALGTPPALAQSKQSSTGALGALSQNTQSRYEGTSEFRKYIVTRSGELWKFSSKQ